MFAPIAIFDSLDGRCWILETWAILANFDFFWLILYISCLESVLLRDWILSLDLQRDV